MHSFNWGKQFLNVKHSSLSYKMKTFSEFEAVRVESASLSPLSSSSTWVKSTSITTSDEQSTHQKTMLIKAVYTAFLAIFIVLLLVRKQDGQPYRTYYSHVNDVFYFMFSPAIGRVKLQRNQLQFHSG